MLLDFVKFAYSAGELSPDLHARGDLEGFQLGYREGLNVFVDWRGGLKTRPGTLMCEPIFEDPDNEGVRLSAFSFNADPEDNYLLVWLHQKLRFIQNNRYLLTGDVFAGNALLTAPSKVGSLVQVVGGSKMHLFTGKVVNANTVKVPYKDQTVTLSPASREARLVYEITTPYSKKDLHDLKFEQFRDQIIISHIDYEPRVLRRTLSPTGNPVFNISTYKIQRARAVAGKISAQEDRINDLASKTGGFQWTVGVVDKGGNEFPIPISDGKLESGVDIGTKVLNLSWDADEEAELYRIYGSQFQAAFGESLSPYSRLRIPIRAASADIRFAGATETVGATFVNNLVYFISNTRVDIRAYNLDGSASPSNNININTTTVVPQGLFHTGTTFGGIGSNGEIFTLEGNDLLVRGIHTPRTGWEGAVFAQGWIWTVSLANVLAQVDPVSFQANAVFQGPTNWGPGQGSANWANNARALVYDGSYIWIIGARGRAIAFNPILGVFVESSNITNLQPPSPNVQSAFFVPSSERIYTVNVSGVAHAFDLSS